MTNKDMRTPANNVGEQLLEWSKDRPAWQRDALRRFAIKGDLTTADLLDLTDLCKARYGLSTPADAVPLKGTDLPPTGQTASVVLKSIFHHKGVNALAEGQTLNFSRSLSLIYGDNAAGKTGYIRILKTACRARGREEILGNVVAGNAPQRATVAVAYAIGGDGIVREWTGATADEHVARVSVFDSHAATVYLNEKTDVAFRPFGLDLFDKLVRACKTVRSNLEREQKELGTSKVEQLKASLESGSAPWTFVWNLSSLNTVEEVELLATYDTHRLAALEKTILDLQSTDPKRLGAQLVASAERLRSLQETLQRIERELSPSAANAGMQTKREADDKERTAKAVRENALSRDLLLGTGNTSWMALWEAARRFSESHAYRGQGFPVVDSGARCLLCQEVLPHSAGERLRRFEHLVTSTAEREMREARERLSNLQSSLIPLNGLLERATSLVKDVQVEDEKLALKVTEALGLAKMRVDAFESLLSGEDGLILKAEFSTFSGEVGRLAEMQEARGRTLKIEGAKEARDNLQVELRELRSRALFAKNRLVVVAEIERMRRVAAYELAINDTKTQAITQKSTAVTRLAVTESMKVRFKKEVERLGFKHIEVELREVGGADGVLFHKLALTRAPHMDVPRVVSEGEQRCLAIAAFFAELATADDSSAIVFDDPVSSLDYRWRESVAQRLVEEAKIRQVIVFTHDIVFLLVLRQLATELGVEQIDQHVRHLGIGAGVCTEELPWVALPVSKKVGYLRNEQVKAAKLFREGHKDAYDKEAKYLYGLLREAWERALEEVLLGGVVERYRPGVQTQQLGKIADITEADCSALDAAMTKCSKWLHDQAPAARVEVPDPDVLKTDIEDLDAWIKAIRSRRKR